jgi:hypothetical protein
MRMPMSMGSIVVIGHMLRVEMFLRRPDLPGYLVRKVKGLFDRFNDMFIAILLCTVKPFLVFHPMTLVVLDHIFQNGTELV